MTKKVSTEPYKGVRDFYPEDKAVQNYIFDTWKNVCERFGYEAYGASILEPTELYTSKTSEEIVNEQTYTFTDRGDRSVTLRPEMTPTVARMIAAKRRELGFPARWYSIENFFRYERPQRGRVREFWQLNADIFGASGVEAEVEIISLAYDIMKAFGAKDEDFEIRINNRGALKQALVANGLSDEDAEKELSKVDKSKGDLNVDEKTIAAASQELLDFLKKRGVANAKFDAKLIRGFSYYTGMVFEVFDTNKENTRSIFGGGRYDRLLELFGDEVVPAVGFGLGDVTMRDFLETHKLLPDYTPATELYIATVDASFIPEAMRVADELRAKGAHVAVNLTDKKIGDQIKTADKLRIPFVIAIGKEEAESKTYALKTLATGEEETLALDAVLDRIC